MFTFFVLMNATKEWLALAPEARQRFVADTVQPILEHYPRVEITFYDVEAFSARCSDIAMFEAPDLNDYAALIDALRNTKLYAVPYFEIVEIFPAKKADFV